MDRYLHKFGEKQNIQRQAERDAENVADKIKPWHNSEKNDKGETLKASVDVKEMKRLHDGGMGWNAVGEKFGMTGTYAKRLIKDYEETIENESNTEEL